MKPSAARADDCLISLKRVWDPKNRHIFYFLFWPVYGLRYLLVEQFNPAAQYHLVYCPLDDRIPFQEVFLIPYVFWYALIIGMHLYTFVKDASAFKWYSRYLIISMSISTLIFLLYPTCQELRPEQFPRDNLLTDAVRLLYRVDTNTNVCPSEHVIGAIAAFCAGVHSEKGKNLNKIVLLTALAFSAGIATVFLKQHSMVDVFAALPVCAVTYLICQRLECRH